MSGEASFLGSQRENEVSRTKIYHHLTGSETIKFRRVEVASCANTPSTQVVYIMTYLAIMLGVDHNTMNDGSRDKTLPHIE